MWIFFFFGAKTAFKSFIKTSLRLCQVSTQLVAENTFISPGLSQHPNQTDAGWGRGSAEDEGSDVFTTISYLCCDVSALCGESGHKGNLHTKGFLCSAWALTYSTYEKKNLEARMRKRQREKRQVTKRGRSSYFRHFMTKIKKSLRGWETKVQEKNCKIRQTKHLSSLDSLRTEHTKKLTLKKTQIKSSTKIHKPNCLCFNYLY